MSTELTISVILSIVLALWNLFQQWKLKSIAEKSEKSLQIHRLQFEKEFGIYEELWAKIIELRNDIQLLRPRLDFLAEGKTPKEQHEERMNNAVDSANATIDIFEKNKPFYAGNIYGSLNELTRVVKSEIIDAQHGDKSSRQYWKEGENNVNEMIQLTEDVCVRIRERIGTLDK